MNKKINIQKLKRQKAIRKRNLDAVTKVIKKHQEKGKD